jgi:tetratricopeptide (TPR) repeat protein
MRGLPDKNFFASRRLLWLAIPAALLLAWLLYQFPPIHERLFWRVELARTYVRGIIYPAGPVPTPLAQLSATPEPVLTATPTPTFTLTPVLSPTITPTVPSPTPLPSPTAIPPAVELPAPEYIKQTINNCGPATLAMNLKYYGWDGTQETISELIKPVPEDRNVNVEELVYYVRTRAGWLNAEFRVGGNLELLKQFIAAGIPVMIEESFHIAEVYWPNDDQWAAHYLLLTGYDDTRQVFIGQDSFDGPNRAVEYAVLDRDWQIFNRVYILVFPPERQAEVQSIVGEDWDVDTNRQNALDIAQAETESDPQNPYPWFNLGSNMVYFGRYLEASQAYDQARTLGLPQRMLRYQFGPFFAYFHSGRNDDLLTLTEYALLRTPNAEEALLWHGWGLYRAGDSNKAVEQFYKALEANPYYQDAVYALDYVTANP